jgi:hypothetical protein
MAAEARPGQLDVVNATLFADTYSKEGEGQGWDISQTESSSSSSRLPTAPARLMVVVNWQQLMKSVGGKEVAR